MIFKSTGKRGLFDEQNAIDMMSEMGNSLERLNKVVDFEMFRPLLEERLRAVNRKNNAGARPFDYVMMFKIMILQRLFGLSDKQVQYQITDRLSFKEFLGLSSGDKVPDEKSVWLFREKLTKEGVVDELFTMFHNHLNSRGLIVNEGKMVDASFTTAPRQHNTPDENKKIKNGEGDELWNDKPYKKRQKDIDARWTKKGGDTFYGYKNHAKVDTKSKLIDGYVVTDASVHDSQPLDDLLCEDDRGQDFHADSAYTGENQDAVIDKYGVVNKVCEKGYRNKPLTDEQKASNREKSKIRARVEHVFGFMEQTMQGLHLRSIGLDRAKGIVGLINLTYNMCRFEQIVRLKII